MVFPLSLFQLDASLLLDTPLVFDAEVVPWIINAGDSSFKFVMRLIRANFLTTGWQRLGLVLI